MDIYTKRGEQVIVTEKTAKNGLPSDQELIAKHLEIGVPYTVDFTDVRSWSTKVHLAGFQGIEFNSVMFENHYDYEAKFKEFSTLKNDKQRWVWIKENQNLTITVYLDNDDTYAMFDKRPEIGVLQFDYYIGNSEGVVELLNAMGIKNEEV